MTNYYKLSIVIPVFNEVKTIERLIQAVSSVSVGLEKEIVIIDDASTDGTRNILNKYKNIYKVVFMDRNQGKGAAVIRGFKETTGDIVIIQDADLEYNPEEYPLLIKPILDGKTEIVYGSRFLRTEESGQQNIIVYKRGYLFSRFLNGTFNLLSGLHLSDMYTCYKVFSRNAVDKIYPYLVSERFGIDPELTALAARFGFRIIEVPISYKGRTYEEGKKINWKDGLAAIWHIIRFNLFTIKNNKITK